MLPLFYAVKTDRIPSAKRAGVMRSDFLKIGGLGLLYTILIFSPRFRGFPSRALSQSLSFGGACSGRAGMGSMPAR